MGKTNVQIKLQPYYGSLRTQKQPETQEMLIPQGNGDGNNKILQEVSRLGSRICTTVLVSAFNIKLDVMV